MYIALVIDITESKSAEQALLAAQSELNRLSQLTTIGDDGGVDRTRNKPAARGNRDAWPCSYALAFQSSPGHRRSFSGSRPIVESAERVSTIINGIRALFKTDNAEKTTTSRLTKLFSKSFRLQAASCIAVRFQLEPILLKIFRPC